MICTQCQTNEATMGTLCQSCVQINRARQRTSASFSRTLSSTSPSIDLPIFKYFTVFAFAAVVALGSFFWGRLNPEKLPEQVVQKHMYDCVGRKQCVVIMLAPWCGACHGSIGFIKALRNEIEKHDDFGLGLVVGLSNNDGQLTAMANQLGGDVFIDKDREFSSQVTGSAVPRWWVINREYSVTEKGSGLIANTDQQSVTWFMREELGLDAKSTDL